MKYYMPQVIIDWNMFGEAFDLSDIVPRLGTKFCPVYETLDDAVKYNPGVGILELEQVSTADATLTIVKESTEESKP